MNQPRVAITIGDPAGIGPEVMVKALQNKELPNHFTPVLVGHRPSFLAASREWNPGFNLVGNQFSVGTISGEFVDIAAEITDPLVLGKISRDGGLISGQAIQTAVQLIRDGQAAGLVTGPIHKKALHLAGFDYPGHTEFLADLSGAKNFAMMLVGKKIRVVLVTTHVALADVSACLRSVEIAEKIELTHDALVTHFGINSPRIAVAGLNPHAGDGGRFGDEEARLITPAIKRANESGIDASGPYPADSLFPRVMQGDFAAVVVMYHDQGLIPVKMEAFGQAVNVTLGLPFVRTSVDHGTAYDIAGAGMAHEGSMVQAIKLALQMIESMTI